MQLEVSQYQGSGGFSEVTVTHKGEQLFFQSSTYGKVNVIHTPARVFEEINGYWAWLPEEAQDKIWNCYVEIKDHLDNVPDILFTSNFIKKRIKEMYKHMPMASFQRWLLTMGNLYIPPDTKDTIDEDSRYPRTDQTYLKEDYINLAVLSLAIRPLLPIWGEYIDPERQSGSNDLYKEMSAVGLIAETELVEWPVEKPAFEKLLNYIRISIEEVPIQMGSILKGIGSAEIPYWLQAKVLVRRLTIVPLSDHQIGHSIIANIYRYVGETQKPNYRRATDRVNDKRQDRGSGGDEDDKTSFLEEYKIKQRVATGDATTYDVFGENIAGIVQHVDPTMDLSLLVKCADVVPRVEKLRIHQHQVLLAQWVLAKGFSPRAYMHVKKSVVNRLLAATQAVLWHWKFYDIACYMQVEQISSTVQDVPGISKSPRSGTRISRKYDADLVELFPHAKPQRISQRKQHSQTDGVNRSGNYAAIAINNLTRMMMSYDWYYHGPKELKILTDQPEGRGLLVTPPKIKDQVTELAIHLAKINQ